MVFLLFTQESKILKFLGFMWNPLSWVMEAAAIMSIALARGGVRIIFYHETDRQVVEKINNCFLFNSGQAS